jgi:hypothetical protein
MRKITTLSESIDGFRRLMIFSCDGGAYLFFFKSLTDGPCDRDDWYESVEEAESSSERLFAVNPDDWISIADPIPGAQHDWISPTRTKLGGDGLPKSGEFEPIPLP